MLEELQPDQRRERSAAGVGKTKVKDYGRSGFRAMSTFVTDGNFSASAAEEGTGQVVKLVFASGRELKAEDTGSLA